MKAFVFGGLLILGLGGIAYWALHKEPAPIEVGRGAMDSTPTVTGKRVADVSAFDPLPAPMGPLPEPLPMPETLEPQVSESWNDFLRREGEPDLEENLVVAHGEYKKAFRQLAQQIAPCGAPTPEVSWVGRAQKALVGQALPSEGHLLRALNYRHRELETDCLGNLLSEAVRGESEFLDVVKLNLELAQKYNEVLESEEQALFQNYIQVLRDQAGLPQGPLKSLVTKAGALSPTMVDENSLDFFRQDPSFQKAFDIEKAKTQWPSQ